MLQIVQGDIFEINFELCEVDKTAIKKVVFSSKCLGITEDSELTEEGYRVRISGEYTAKLPSGFAFYDLTIVFIDGQQITAKRNDIVEVLKKENNVDG